MRKMTLKEFYQWLEKYPQMLMDGQSISYMDIEDDNVSIVDMDEELPNLLINVDEESEIEMRDDGSVNVSTRGPHSCAILDWEFVPLDVVLKEDCPIADQSEEDEYLTKKEMIAGILFEDNKLGEHYERPSEEDCHILAEEILKRIDSTVTTEDFVQVIVLDREDELIEEMVRFPETNEGNEKAEKLFLDKCEHYFTNWDEYSDEDVEAILEQGYEQNNKYKVMLHHD